MLENKYSSSFEGGHGTGGLAAGGTTSGNDIIVSEEVITSGNRFDLDDEMPV